MALSFINTCYYPKCGMSFNSQHHLIIHIESAHVDFNPHTIDEVEKSRFQNFMVPPSYILKYNLNDEVFPCNISIKEEIVEDDLRLSSDHNFPSSSESMFGFNNDGVIVKIEPIDFNKLDYQDFNFDDSYKKAKSNKSLIISQGGKKRKIPPLSDNARKFACPFQGCNKKYKNLNGARYHTKHCHDSYGNTIKPRKDYHCACGKQYKTAAGLCGHLQVYSDKSHGVIITNIVNLNDTNNNKNIIMPRPISTPLICSNDPCSQSFDCCHMSTICQSAMRDISGVGCLAHAGMGGRGLWQMKGDYGSVVYDDRMRIFKGVGVGVEITDSCQIKYEQSHY